MKMANWNVWKYMFISIPIPYDFVYPSDIGTTASKSNEKGTIQAQKEKLQQLNQFLPSLGAGIFESVALRVCL